MNLEEYLLQNGVKCKETVEYLVKNGLVTINNKRVDYTKIPVGENDTIDIVTKEFNQCPKSYWKIKKMDEKINLINRGDFVLSVESQDGGFPLFAARKKANVKLLTIRDDMNFLRKEGVEIIRKNVFKDDMKKVFSSKFDTIIVEAGFSPIRTIELMDKLRGLVGSRGRVLILIKKEGDENPRDICEEMMIKQRLEITDCFKEDRGTYILAKSF